MTVKHLLKLSTRMFKARTSRTLLTIFGMGIGIGAILFLVSLGYGLQKALLERITTSESLLSLDVTSSKSEVIAINQELLDKISNLKGVAEVSPAYQVGVYAEFENMSVDSSAIVVKPSFLKLEGLKLSKGDGLDDAKKEQIIVSSAFASVLNVPVEELIGKEMKLSLFIPRGENLEEGVDNYETVKLSGSYKISGTVEGEELYLYVNLSSLDQSVTFPSFSRLKVKCATSEELDPIREQILAFGLSVSSLSDTVKQANQVFKIVQIILALFGIIALIVSAIGMFNTMTVTLLERTEEIGIMKSIGASNGDILMMFVVESTIMGFFGGISGVLLGVLGSKLFNYAINFMASRLGGEPVTLFYSPGWFMLLILGFATVVGMITGLIPARRASSIDPLDALRYK